MGKSELFDWVWKGVIEDMNIKGKMVTLRAVDYQDMDFMRRMLNDPEIEGLVVGWSFPISSAQQEQWFSSAIQDNCNQRFVIETPNDGEVGIYVLSDIDWKNRVACTAIKLANSRYRNKGIGTDAAMAVMRYAFDELNLNRLSATWFEENTPSQKLHLRCGYQVEGCVRDCVYKNGHYHNLMIGGILRTEYYQMIKENGYWE